MTVVLHSTITANQLTPEQPYGLGFEWTGAAGSIDGSISPVKADEKGHGTWPAFPTIFQAIASEPGPGVLKLFVIDTNGDPIPHGHVASYQIA